LFCKATFNLFGIGFLKAAEAKGGQQDDSEIHTSGNGENLERTE
jgi:hypothetical protein